MSCQPRHGMGGIFTAMQKTTLPELGIAVGPHLFRNCAVFTVATPAGHRMAVASALLHHTDPRAEVLQQRGLTWCGGCCEDPSEAGCEQHLAVFRCDDFIEQREHSRVPPHVVDANQCGGAVLWTQGFERKVVCSI